MGGMWKNYLATNDNELSGLEALLNRGKKNNLRGLRLLNSKEINKIEPHVNAKKGILLPEESIVNYKRSCEKISGRDKFVGGEIKRFFFKSYRN